MTEIELRARIFEDLNALLDNESAMLKLRAFLSRLRKETALASPVEHTEPYTMEKLNARLDEAEAADEADELTAHEEVMRKAYQYLTTL